jgi:hypothetical protein
VNGSNPTDGLALLVPIQAFAQEFNEMLGLLPVEDVV